jgi:hypothetical protein
MPKLNIAPRQKLEANTFTQIFAKLLFGQMPKYQTPHRLQWLINLALVVGYMALM